jgi:hypothetical protein
LQRYINELTPGWAKLNTLIGITSHFVWCHQTGGGVVHQNEVRVKHIFCSLWGSPMYLVSIPFIGSHLFPMFLLTDVMIPSLPVHVHQPTSSFAWRSGWILGRLSVCRRGNESTHGSGLSSNEQRYVVLQVWQRIFQHRITVEWNSSEVRTFPNYTSLNNIVEAWAQHVLE